MLSFPRILTATIVVAASMAAMVPAHAQLAGKRSERRAQQQEQQQQAPRAEAEFPEASREEPSTRPSQRGVREIQSLSKLYEENKYAELLPRAVQFAQSTNNSYEKAFAYQLAAAAANGSDDMARAAEYFRQAVDANGLDNNNHYRTMVNLAVAQAQLDQHAEALATLDRFLAETRSQDSKYLAMRGSLLAGAERHEEAARLFQQLLEQSPDDKRLLMNAFASYQRAEKDAEANALLQQARSRGLLTETNEYRLLYSGLLNDGNWKEAVSVIEEGVSRNLLPQDGDLAKAWSVVANRAYFDDDLDAAARYYRLAAPLAADGETWLNLAKVYNQQGDKARTREAAQEALNKGVANRDEATRLANIK